MKKFLIIILLLFSLDSMAQGEKYQINDSDYSNKNVEMADVMRSNGKIYVVVGVVFLIFLGLTIYVVRIDKKISKLESELDQALKQ
ncbi:MAG: CcmD family protein [Cyclobacteriaceae bacterium]